MIITFEGTDKSNNAAKKVVAAVGSMLSLSNNKKVCIIELTNDAVGVEELLRGKKLLNTDIFKKRGVSDKGIDALIRKASTMKLNKTHFYTAVSALMQSENRLDIVRPSSKKSFYEDLFADENIEPAKRVIQDADKFYDFVLVLMPNNAKIINEFIRLGEVNVSCIRQAGKEEPFLTDKKNTLLVTNYDPESSYDLKRISREYKDDVAKIKCKFNTFLYNTQFRDSCHEFTLLSWMLKNYNVSVTDINYDFISGLQKFVDYISDTEAEETPEPTLKKRVKTPKIRDKKKRSIGDLEDVSEEELAMIDAANEVKNMEAETEKSTETEE